MDSSSRLGCDFDGSETDVAMASEDNFGLYIVVNPKFRCTSGSNATTQFWIGGAE